jgi:uncharacterized membrane-anchored protein YhcB (DUF1043 family)
MVRDAANSCRARGSAPGVGRLRWGWTPTVEQLDFRLPIVGAIVGWLLGALYHRLTRPARPAAGSIQKSTREPTAEERRRVVSLVERAARVMIAYSHMIDAANAGDGAELERLFRALRQEEADEELAQPVVDDRLVRDAAAAFLRLHGAIEAKIAERLAAGQTVQIGGELRLRAAELGGTVDTLNRATSRYTSTG